MSPPSGSLSLRVLSLVAVAFSLSCQLDQLIQPSQPAGLVVDPPAVADSAPLGSTANRTRSLTIRGDDPSSSWRASLAAGSAWLQLGRMEDTVPSNVSVSLNPAGLTVGAHEDTILLKTTTDRDPVRVPVKFMVMSSGGSTQASRLVFTVQPNTTVARAVITPAVRVEAWDGTGNRAQSFTGPITLSFGANPGSGNLSGTATVNAVGGVAVFNNLSIDRPGTGYTLNAVANGMSGATSAPFNITSSTPPRLSFVVHPTSFQAGNRIAPAVVVTALDASGTISPGYTGSVTVALGANPGGGTLGGTRTASAVAGVVVFSDLTVDRAGNGYTLVVSANGYASAESHTFNVTAVPPSGTRSTITVSPGTIVASNGSSTATVTVTARDAAGNVLAGVPISLSSSGGGNTINPASATTNTSGVVTATFSSTGAGNKTVTATASGVTITPPAPVTVTAGAATRLVFTVQPSDADNDKPISPAVQVSATDAFGNLAASYTGNVTVTLASGRSESTLRGMTTRPAVGGVATFAGLNVHDGKGGGYSLAASAPGLTSAVSNTFKID